MSLNYKYYKLKDQYNNDLAVFKTRNLAQRIYSYFFERKDLNVFYKFFNNLAEFESYYFYLDFKTRSDRKEYPMEYQAYCNLTKNIPCAIYQGFRQTELSICRLDDVDFISEEEYFIEILQLVKYKKVEEINESQWFGCKLNPLENMRLA